MIRGFLEGIPQNQVRHEIRKTIGDKDKTIANALERALHLEDVNTDEEEEQTLRIAAVSWQSNQHDFFKIKS